MSESKKISSHASNDLGSKRPSYIKIQDESPVLRDCKITMTRIYRSALGTVQIQLPTFTEHEGRRSYLVIPLLPREGENFSNMEINDQEKTCREYPPRRPSNRKARKISPMTTLEVFSRL